MMKRAAGGVLLLFGALLVGWVGYNLLVAPQPEAQGKSPLPAVFFAGALLYVGYRWVQGEPAE